MENFSMKKLVGELLGTFALVLIGTGVAVFTTGVSALTVALAFGLTFAVLVSVGGGQYNPAVSLAMAVRKQITWVEFVLNAVAQIVGGLVAALTVWLLAGSNASLGANSFGDMATMSGLIVIHGGDKTMGMILALVVEVLVTFLFVLTVLRATRVREDGETNKHAPFVIGLALTVLVAFALPLTGGSLNPARSLGPALLQGGDALSMVWVYLVAPLVGGVIAAVVDQVL